MTCRIYEGDAARAVVAAWDAQERTVDRRLAYRGPSWTVTRAQFLAAWVYAETRGPIPIANVRKGLFGRTSPELSRALDEGLRDLVGCVSIGVPVVRDRRGVAVALGWERVTPS